MPSPLYLNQMYSNRRFFLLYKFDQFLLYNPFFFSIFSIITSNTKSASFISARFVVVVNRSITVSTESFIFPLDDSFSTLFRIPFMLLCKNAPFSICPFMQNSRDGICSLMVEWIAMASPLVKLRAPIFISMRFGNNRKQCLRIRMKRFFKKIRIFQQSRWFRPNL